jgi:peptide/nickel transport system substrate-binding protein
MRMNHLTPPFNNPAIRRAVLHAVNQADFMTAVAGTDPRYWRADLGIFPPGSPFASDAGMEIVKGPQDPAVARREITAAGYAGETVVVLAPGNFPTIKALAEVSADLLAKCGMKVEMQSYDWGTLLKHRSNKGLPQDGGWNVFCTTFDGIDQYTPAGHLALRGNGEAGWAGWASSPRIEELRNAWFQASDIGEAKAIAAAIQKQAFIDVPYVPLGRYDMFGAWRKDLTGFLQGPALFWNVRRS